MLDEDDPKIVELIRQIIEDIARRTGGRDISGVSVYYASNVVVFENAGELRTVGIRALRDRLEEWLREFDGPIDFETSELSVSAGRTIAFASGLRHATGMNDVAEKIDMWWRVTICFRRINGSWLVTHQHSSVPFDMSSGTASIHL